MEVELKNVGKRFDKLEALKGLTFRVAPGKVTAVVGVNGAGKSTLLNLLGGLLFPDSGDLRLDGGPFDRSNLAFRRKLFFLPVVPPVNPELTPLQHAAMVFGFYEKQEDQSLRENLLDLYAELDLLEVADIPMQTLSMGQAYKSALAPLLLLNGSLWLFDEPFASGMDAVGMKVFRDRALQAAQEGATVLFSTQILEIAEGFADQILVLHRGRLVEYSPTRTIQARSREGKLGDELVALFQKLRNTPSAS